MDHPLIPSLAILKVNWDSSGQDPIDNFVPFVTECIRVSNNEEVSLKNIKETITSKFGFNIPEGVLKTILNRAEKSGYVRKDKGVLIRNQEKLSTLGFENLTNDITRKHNALLHKIKDFCKKKYTDWDLEKIEKALHIYLQTHSIPVLETVVKRNTGPDIGIFEENDKPSNFLISQFILDLCENDPTGFEYLETVIKGSVLVNVLYEPFFPVIGDYQRTLKKTRIYFDTSFLLKALGFTGEHFDIPCLELIDLVYELNGLPSCFEHTIDEIRGILDFAIVVAKRPELGINAGDAIEHLTTNHSPSTILMYKNDLLTKLQKIKIKSKPTPEHTIPLGIDEIELDNILQETIRYKREETRKKDLYSLSGIHRLRYGRQYSNIEESKAIFVTTNNKLVIASNRFFKERLNYGDIPHCIMDYHLMTILWLKKPLRAPDLPRKVLIANCYAALKPSDGLWARYLSEIKNLKDDGGITEQDYQLLRYSIGIQKIVMEVTKGDISAFSEGSIFEIRQRVISDLFGEKDIEINDLKTRLADKKEDDNKKKERLNEIRNRIKKISEYSSNIISNIMFVILTILFILSSLYSVVLGVLEIALNVETIDIPLPLYITVFILSSLLIVFTAIDLVFGKKIINPFRRRFRGNFEKSLEKSIYGLLSYFDKTLFKVFKSSIYLPN